MVQTNGRVAPALKQQLLLGLLVLLLAPQQACCSRPGSSMRREPAAAADIAADAPVAAATAQRIHLRLLAETHVPQPQQQRPSTTTTAAATARRSLTAEGHARKLLDGPVSGLAAWATHVATPEQRQQLQQLAPNLPHAGSPAGSKPAPTLKDVVGANGTKRRAA